MVETREMVTAAGTLECAVGIGFFMQTGDAAEQRYGGVGEVAVSAASVTVVNPLLPSANPYTKEILEVEDIVLTSAQSKPAQQSEFLVLASAHLESEEVELPVLENIQLVSATGGSIDTSTAELAEPTVSCEITAEGIATKAAMIELTLNAPCLPNERVTVHHRGMMFTETTSATGTLEATMPALDQNALVIFAFSNGDGAVTQLEVPELRQYNRTAIQWKGDAGLEMHAREFGANYGEDGHVWKDAARTSAAVGSSRGFLTRLGNANIAEGLMAEVYTFPTAMSSQFGIVDLSVEAEVTALNCGLEVEAQSLEVVDGDVIMRDLTLAVPDCDAKGSFLVLNNLVEDLKVASN